MINSAESGGILDLELFKPEEDILKNELEIARTDKDIVAEYDQLGYHPSAVARSLIQQRSYTLGVITFGLQYVGPSRTLNGIAHQAEANGYALLLNELAEYDVDHIQSVIQSILAITGFNNIITFIIQCQFYYLSNRCCIIYNKYCFPHKLSPLSILNKNILLQNYNIFDLSFIQ